MNGWGVRVRNTSAVFILGGVDCLSDLPGGPSLQGSVCQLGAGPMVGGHQWRPHVSPPCSPASWPRSCMMGLAQAPGLFELPIWPWVPLRELVGGAPQLLAVGGVPWGFAPLCCGSQRAPGCPALPKGRPVAPSADLWSGCGQSFPPLLPPAPTPLPPTLGTHSIPGRPPGLLTGTAHRPLPGGSIPSSPAFCPVKQGLLPQADALPLAKKKGNLAPDSVLASRQDQCSLQDGCHPELPSGSPPWSLTQCDVAVSKQIERLCRFLGSGQCPCSCLLKGCA